MRINENIRIVGRNVILVPYKVEHVERYHEWMKSKELQHLTGSEPLTLEEEYQMQKRWLYDPDKCTFIILEKSVFLSSENETESMIGDTNLFLDNNETCNAEIEIMIADASYRGKKRGWEATVLMLLYGMDVLNIVKYIAKIKFDNEKSIKMFQKLGFQEIERSNVFQEVTFHKIVDQSWRKTLCLEVMDTPRDQIYEKNISTDTSG